MSVSSFDGEHEYRKLLDSIEEALARAKQAGKKHSLRAKNLNVPREHDDIESKVREASEPEAKHDSQQKPSVTPPAIKFPKQAVEQSCENEPLPLTDDECSLDHFLTSKRHESLRENRSESVKAQGRFSSTNSTLGRITDPCLESGDATIPLIHTRLNENTDQGRASARLEMQKLLMHSTSKTLSDLQKGSKELLSRASSVLASSDTLQILFNSMTYRSKRENNEAVGQAEINRIEEGLREIQDTLGQIETLSSTMRVQYGF